MDQSRFERAPAQLKEAARRPPHRRPVTPAQRDKNEATRRKLIDAAAKVIGRYGYAGASIARITAKAGIAHGAFYLHFKSQQDLFDAILPTVGGAMLDAISKAVRDSRDLEELEFRGIKANFAYLVRHPEIHRIMNEAELHAPRAFARYLAELTRRYSGSLRRTFQNKPHPRFRDDELETLAAMLEGARAYLLMKYCQAGRRIKPLPDAVISTYVRFVLDGLRGGKRQP
jgi:AcrR family transcriptional regulator